MSAVIPGFGSFTCVAQAPGSVPRIASCIVHVDACPLSPDFRSAPADDGRTFDFSLWTRWSACHGNSGGGTLVFTLTLAPFTPPPTPLPEPTVPVNVTFAGLTTNRAPVSTYVENGVTITTVSADWMAATTYGNPAPSLQFSSPAGEATQGEIRITAGGRFSFSSIDLHSSTVGIPLVVEGTLGSELVLWSQKTFDTTGSFFTFQNPRPRDAIDTLVIRMPNNSAPCCVNPMSVDNIVIRRPALE